jgi:hypothetical protein
MAGASVKLVPQMAARMGGKRALILEWEKSIGAMRVIDCLVP